jgi:hypothetical protein
MKLHLSRISSEFHRVSLPIIITPSITARKLWASPKKATSFIFVQHLDSHSITKLHSTQWKVIEPQYNERPKYVYKCTIKLNVAV